MFILFLIQNLTRNSNRPFLIQIEAPNFFSMNFLRENKMALNGPAMGVRWLIIMRELSKLRQFWGVSEEETENVHF